MLPSTGNNSHDRRTRHNFPSCENRIFPLAFFNVSALAAAALEPDQPNPAAVLLPSLLEPDQLNACGGGGFCRRCCWSPNSRTPAAVLLPSLAGARPAERLRRRWILPSLAGARPAESPAAVLLPSLLEPDQLNHLRPFCCPRCWSPTS